MYSEKIKAAVISEYHSGAQVVSLSEKYGVSQSTIYSWTSKSATLPSSKYAKKPAVRQKDYEDLRRHSEKLEQIVSAFKELYLCSLLTLDEKLGLYYEYQGKYSSKVLCEVLGLSRGTYSKRIVNHREPSYTAEHRAEVKERLTEIFDNSQQRFGADKLLAVLQKEGFHTSKQTVCSIMKELGLQSVGVNAKREYIKDLRVKRNIINRDFKAEAPNMRWVGDITQFWFNENKYYICAILGLYSRKVVGYKVSKNSSTKLVSSTLRTAYEQRGCPQNLIFHSDRGTQYTSKAYTALLSSYGITQSFSHKGSPCDNAVIESFFSFLKREELHRRIYRSERDFLQRLDEYISYYNSQRPHRYNGYKTPDDAEKMLEKSMVSDE